MPIQHIKYHARYNQSGDFMTDWITLGEPFNYNGLELIPESINVNYVDFSADIRAYDEATKENYLITQRDIHSFLEKL